MAISSHDIVPDSPTNVFCTLNPLLLGGYSNSTLSFSDGNTKISTSSSNAYWTGTGATHGMTISDNFYAEVYIVTGTYFSHSFGVCYHQRDTTFSGTGVPAAGGTQPNVMVVSNGQVYKNGSLSTTITAPASGDVIGVYFDGLNSQVVFTKNGSTWHTETNISNNTYVFTGFMSDGSYQVWNFGQDPTFGGNKNTPATVNSVTGPFAPSGTAAGTAGLFYYPPPADALALCTANLPDPTIDPNKDDLPEDYFKAVTYTGTSSADSGTTFDNLVGFKSDLVWIKERGNAYSHQLFDSVRGTDVAAKTGKSLATQSTAAEDSVGGSYPGELYQFTDNGFKINRTSSARANNSGASCIAWCWKAGGSPSATDDGTGVSGSAKLVNTSGTASSTTCKSFKDAAVTAGASNVICPSKMSINQKAGFSIIKYTGTSGAATIPHGLSSAPEFYIVKETTATGPDASWGVYYVPEVLKLKFNEYAGGSGTNAGGGGNMTTDLVTASVLGIKSGTSNANNVNNSGSEYIIYAWHSVAGYSKFGSFESTSSGVFVYLGFRPALIISKYADGTGSWSIYDNKRQPSNTGASNVLYPDLASEEASNTAVYNFEFLSNGFRSFGTGTTFSSGTHLFIAFAEMPFKYANAR